MAKRAQKASGALPLGDDQAGDQAVETGASQAPEGGNLTEGEPSAVVEPKEGELDSAVANLGEAVAREAGGYDLSEEAHLSAIERAEKAATDWVFNPSQLVNDARDFMLDQIKSRPKPWGGSSPSEQRDIAAACAHAGDELVRKIAEAIAARGQEPVRVLLDKIALGETIQITGKVKTMSAEEEDRAVMILHHARGKNVMLTVASKDDYHGGERPAPGVPEESPPLPFEAGADEFDAALGAEHLADGEEAELEPGLTVVPADGVKTGNEIDGLTLRVNLKTGQIETLPEGSVDMPENWCDERQATPAELAAERERTADFDDDSGQSDQEEEAPAVEAAES